MDRKRRAQAIRARIAEREAQATHFEKRYSAKLDVLSVFSSDLSRVIDAFLRPLIMPDPTPTASVDGSVLPVESGTVSEQEGVWGKATPSASPLGAGLLSARQDGATDTEGTRQSEAASSEGTSDQADVTADVTAAAEPLHAAIARDDSNDRVQTDEEVKMFASSPIPQPRSAAGKTTSATDLGDDGSTRNADSGSDEPAGGSDEAAADATGTDAIPGSPASRSASVAQAQARGRVRTRRLSASAESGSPFTGVRSATPSVSAGMFYRCTTPVTACILQPINPL